MINHFANIPIWLWVVIVLVAAAVLVLRALSQRREAFRHSQREKSRRRSIARYKTWEWVFGRAKNLRISDGTKPTDARDD